MDLKLVGIAAGNPAHLTAAAIEAISQAEVILIPQKGEDKEELSQLRLTLCETFGAGRVIGFDMPVRDPDIADYKTRVNLWHDAIAAAWLHALGALQPGLRVVLLVWGDPSLFDSTLRIAERLRGQMDFTLSVVPGLTSIQLLTAAHAVPLNALAEPFLVTTGRHLRNSGWPAGVDTLVVMLDGDCAFRELDPEGVSIWWGAYLGMPGQILDHGPLSEAGPRIEARRAQARAARGWIMDTYLLRRQRADNAP
ncbi:precorrin-6A synthase (deacetylating) [Falsigemmobacter intermedius]|uniref:Precorrin-6A synthase [deacetylating] n=1 Tax=Falsigemmobacter intermedius TaxID=1553448 RepID=A0A3S3U7G6_9RHOB|nr:precorrin-6A synthase (deacetylating) [Falsigemmobacter intermedius]RWY38824.1 precorrin-6A synthase (deacetylating) [Falsigemmobacter intermedius]